jgi:hypothetical protein
MKYGKSSWSSASFELNTACNNRQKCLFNRFTPIKIKKLA